MEQPPDDKFTIIDSYMKRDYVYNKEKNVKDLFKNYCSKLGIFHTMDKDVDIMKKGFIKKVEHIIMGDGFLPKQTMYDMYDQYKREYSDEYERTHKVKSQRYNKIIDMIRNEDKLYDLYNEFSIDELKCLGW